MLAWTLSSEALACTTTAAIWQCETGADSGEGVCGVLMCLCGWGEWGAHDTGGARHVGQLSLPHLQKVYRPHQIIQLPHCQVGGVKCELLAKLFGGQDLQTRQEATRE